MKKIVNITIEFTVYLLYNESVIDVKIIMIGAIK